MEGKAKTVRNPGHLSDSDLRAEACDELKVRKQEEEELLRLPGTFIPITGLLAGSSRYRLLILKL
jgi:hypothetical protein